MNFTDKFISNTYGNVMVNDPFTNGNPTVVKSPTHDAQEIYNSLNVYGYYTAICDGLGNTSNLYLSISGGENGGPWQSIWPNSRYEVNSNNFILSGNGLDQNRALIYRKDGNNYSFANSNLEITNQYARFGNTQWNYSAGNIDDILMVEKSGGVVKTSFDGSIYSTFQHRRESFQFCNNEQQRSFGGAGGVSITFNYGASADPSKTKHAVFYIFSKCVDCHTGSGVHTWIQYPKFNSKFKLSDQYNDNSLSKDYNGYIIVPYNNSCQTIMVETEKDGGYGRSYTTAGYQTRTDSSELRVKLVGLLNLAN